MRTLLICILALSLSGCATLGGLPGQIDAAVPQVQAVVSSVSAITRKLCGFEPIAATVVGVLTGGASAVPFDIASRICAAIATQPLAATGKRVPVSVVVNGVRISGHVIRNGRGR